MNSAYEKNNRQPADFEFYADSSIHFAHIPVDDVSGVLCIFLRLYFCDKFPKAL